MVVEHFSSTKVPTDHWDTLGDFAADYPIFTLFNRHIIISFILWCKAIRIFQQLKKFSCIISNTWGILFYPSFWLIRSNTNSHSCINFSWIDERMVAISILSLFSLVHFFLLFSYSSVSFNSLTDEKIELYLLSIVE